MTQEIIDLLEKAKQQIELGCGKTTYSFIDQALTLFRAEQPSVGDFTKECRKKLEIYTNLEGERTFTIKDEDEILELFLQLCDRLDASEASRKDLLEALKRAYFLLEINNIKDDYFEALRLKLGDLLPSQVVSEERMKAAIAKAKKEGGE